MQNSRKGRSTRTCRFFRLSCCHETLHVFFKLNFQLMHIHKYSLTELENMLPWEREIYIDLLNQHIEEENTKKSNQ